MRPALSIPFRCLTIAGLTIFSLFLFVGCALPPRPAVKPAAATTRPTIVGEIAVVDEENRFVLIHLESNLYVPPPGAALRAINSSGATAHLRASPEQKRPFVAADIVDGKPAVGDQVLQ